MQEVLSFSIEPHPQSYPNIKVIASVMKRLLFGVWGAVCWVLEAMFVPSPGQKYIDESRDRAIRAGRFMGAL